MRLSHGHPLSSPKKSADELLGEWTKIRLLAVLELVHMWNFLDIKSMVVKELGSHDWSDDIISKILVAQKYSIDHWYAQAYENLIRRKEPLTWLEMKRFDSLPLVEKVTKIREKRVSLGQCCCRTCRRNEGREECWSLEIRDMIKKEFGLKP